MAAPMRKRPFEVLRRAENMRFLREHLRRGLSSEHGGQEVHSEDAEHISPVTDTESSSNLSGSQKLLMDALSEESASSSFISTRTSARLAQLKAQSNQTDEIWTGEESLHDAVLRMLVDKYKPLRGPSMRSAEEKLKAAPPRIRPNSQDGNFARVGKTTADAGPSSSPRGEGEYEYIPDWRTRASEPLLPAVEGHRPWHTTFTPPSSSTAHIRTGTFSPSSARIGNKLDSDSVKIDLATRKRGEIASRLGRARESTLDYQLGVRGSKGGIARRPMPASAKGWTSLVEERIERARLDGQFKTLKGRGHPMVCTAEERNPFIAREEFLMNRIVQRNQAAPAWVELQAELESAVCSFRQTLLQTWVRRAIRLLTSTRPPSFLQTLTISSARTLRDPEWGVREAGYHAAALKEVNELVRRYNGVAPYTVRRKYYVKEAELERVFWECGEEIIEGVKERLMKGDAGARESAGGDDDGGGGGSRVRMKEGRWGFRELIRRWTDGFLS